MVSAIDPQVKRTTGLTPEVRESDRGRARRGDRQPARHRVRRVQRLPGRDGHREDRYRAATGERKQDTSWFAAITNPDNDPALPQYVIVAMVEQGGFGANVAAPIVRRVIDFLNNPMARRPPVVVAPPTPTEQSN